MKKALSTILVIGILIVGLLIYFLTRPSTNIANTTYRSNNQQSKLTNTSNTDSARSAETLKAGTQETPQPDVSFKFTLGTGNFEPKNVNVKKGQQVNLGFEASFRDEVRIDEYDIKNIFVLPLSEHTVQFAADKSGEFRIYLVKRNKTIGTLIVK